MNYAVIFAGGVGSRMHNPTPKQFIEVEHKPVLIHTIESFHRHKLIDSICVVCLESHIENIRMLAHQLGLYKVKYIVPGAKMGQLSIYNGLKAIYDESANPEKDIVLINDGVRPFVSQQVITECIECVNKFGCAVTSAPVPDTIGLVNEDKGIIYDIPDRKKCYALKAPQGFYLSEIISAHHKAMSENMYCFTNSAELFMHYGHDVYTVIDQGVNFKITSPEDLELMRVLLPKWLEGENKSQ